MSHELADEYQRTVRRRAGDQTGCILDRLQGGSGGDCCLIGPGPLGIALGIASATGVVVAYARLAYRFELIERA